MSTAPSAYPELTEPRIDPKHGFTRLLELTPEQAAPYHDLVIGLLEKYQGSKNDSFRRKWTDEDGPHEITALYDRRTPDESSEFYVYRDDRTGQVTSRVTMCGPNTLADPSTWDERGFTMMKDGRIFIVHHFGEIYVYKGDASKDTEMRNKPQSELKELLDRHIEHIETIERQRSTPRAQIAQLGQRVVESVRPDPHRLTPKRMKKMLKTL